MGLDKILFADDDPDIRTLIHMCLENSDFRLEFCESGEEVLKKIPLFKPDLIILDVSMPGMDGISTFELIKKERDTQTIPVIFMTAKKTIKEINTLLDTGAVDVIIKPFKPFAFEQNIRKIWNSKIEKNMSEIIS